jgi:hypothetical protein
MHCYRHLLAAIMPAAVWILSATCASAVEDSEPQSLPLDKVPPAVVKAVMAKFPTAKPKSAAQGVEENRPYIDVHILVDTQKIWVTCDPQGAIRVIDREITLKNLPKAVTTALSKKYPQATVRTVNEISAEGTPTYDIAMTFNKKPIVAVFEASGAFIEEFDDEE